MLLSHLAFLSDAILSFLPVPVKFLSLEFIPEYVDSTINCIKYLSQIGSIQLNWSKDESMKMELDNWVDTEKMIELLDGYRNELFFGDVYIRFTS